MTKANITKNHKLFEINGIRVLACDYLVKFLFKENEYIEIHRLNPPKDFISDVFIESWYTGEEYSWLVFDNRDVLPLYDLLNRSTDPKIIVTPTGLKTLIENQR